MNSEQQIIDSNLKKEYEYGFVTDIESETLPPGLSEEVIHTISKKKDEPVSYTHLTLPTILLV